MRRALSVRDSEGLQDRNGLGNEWRRQGQPAGGGGRWQCPGQPSGNPTVTPRCSQCSRSTPNQRYSYKDCKRTMPGVRTPRGVNFSRTAFGKIGNQGSENMERSESRRTPLSSSTTAAVMACALGVSLTTCVSCGASRLQPLRPHTASARSCQEHPVLPVTSCSARHWVSPENTLLPVLSDPMFAFQGRRRGRSSRGVCC